MSQSPEQHTPPTLSPETEEWAFTPDAGMSEKLELYLDTLVTAQERKELSDKEKNIVLNIHFSFAHSQGSVPGQQVIMEYQRRHLPPMSHEEIDQTAERALVELASYSRFKPPKKHTKSFGNPDELQPEQKKRMVIMEYYQRLSDWTTIMKCETSPLELDYSDVDDDPLLALHELSDQQLLGQIARKIIQRDLDYVETGRPDRETDAERYKSFFREHALNRRHAHTPQLQQMYKDLAAFEQRLQHETPEQLCVNPKEVAILRRKYQSLTKEWEYKNYGQQFDLESPIKKDYDPEAHRKTFHEKIYTIRQNAINILSKGYDLTDDQEANNRRIRAHMEKDPNFISMHDALMEGSKERVEELVSSKELPEPDKQSLRKKLTEKLSNEIEYCDPNDIGDQSFDSYISPVLEHKYQQELEVKEKAVEQQERFKETAATRRQKTQVLGKHSMVGSMVLAPSTPQREINSPTIKPQQRELPQREFELQQELER